MGWQKNITRIQKQLPKSCVDNLTTHRTDDTVKKNHIDVSIDLIPNKVRKAIIRKYAKNARSTNDR
jgi:hypothetical protein